MSESDSETFYEKIHAKRLLILAWTALLCGLLLTIFVSYRVKESIVRYERQKFEMDCKVIKIKIQNRLEKQKQMLLSGAAMLDASENVNRKEWQIYVSRLSLSLDLDGVQALGFSLWIKPEQLKAHEESLRKEGFANYHVNPEGKRDAYSAIVYIEPFQDRNLRAFGYDMYSEPVRNAAMRQAIDSNSVSLSSRVILLQENATDIQAGTLMYAPVYQKNKPIETIEQRRDAIFGWVYSPFRITDLLRNIVLDDDEINVSNLHLRVYDGNQIQDENLLYQSESVSSAPILFSLDTQTTFFGKIWMLHFEQVENEKQTVSYDKVWVAVTMGTFVSLLLFFLLRAYFLMQQNARKIAFKLTKKLREKEEKLALTNADLLQFSIVSAHHLQEPARRLVSFVQRLQKELANTLTINEEAAVALHFIEQSAVRQRALVRDVQLYLSATNPRAMIELVSVVDIVTKVIERNAPLIHRTNAKIECLALPAVILDRPRLFDIFSILLDNALRYTQPDCVPQIRIYGKSKGERICYYVEDNGVGIAAEYRERVFLVFERLQVSENQDSTGIGLSIVRRIVESCNGMVSLKETAGGGITVVLDLPAKP